MAFAGSGFASNEVVSDSSYDKEIFHFENLNAKIIDKILKADILNNQNPCSYTIVYVDRYGDRKTKTGRSEGNVSSVVCSNIVAIEIKKLEETGASVKEFSIEWR